MSFLEVILSETDFPLLGNAAWVDFLNTEPAQPGGGRADLLGEPNAFVRWARAAGLLTRSDPFQPDQSGFKEALEFRAALRDAAESLAVGLPLPKVVIAAVNERLARGPIVSQLVEKHGGWEIKPYSTTSSTAVLLGRLAADFAHTLTSGRADRLRQCEHPNCVMMFIDTSKNGRRRWCSMDTCGNREKAAGHRARIKRSAESG
jgi:predicted RNA-binding Zn ribbon-like protein